MLRLVVPALLFGFEHVVRSAGVLRPMRRYVLVSLAVPVVWLAVSGGTQYLRTERAKGCRANLTQIATAIHGYNERHGLFPAAAILDGKERPLLSWRVAILPQLGYEELYSRFHLDEPWDSPHNLSLLPLMPKVYGCPAEPAHNGRTTYKGIVGSQGMFELNRGIDIREVLDGTSNTALIAEAGPAVPWTKPEDIELVEDGPPIVFSSHHRDGFNIVLADGTSRFVRETIAKLTLKAILTRDGGEVVTA